MILWFYSPGPISGVIFSQQLPQSIIEYPIMRWRQLWENIGGSAVGLVHLWTDQRIPGPLSCRCLEPGWFVGDPASLARDNMLPEINPGLYLE